MSRAARIARPLIIGLVLIGFSLHACGGSKSGSNGSGSGNRPSTAARIQIVHPSANEETGSTVTVEIKLVGGEVVPQSTGVLTGDKGHIHVSLDGKVVAMAYTTTQQLPNLAPGTHTIQAEFVAIDHQPFRNRPIAAVIFSVKP